MTDADEVLNDGLAKRMAEVAQRALYHDIDESMPEYKSGVETLTRLFTPMLKGRRNATRSPTGREAGLREADTLALVAAFVREHYDPSIDSDYDLMKRIDAAMAAPRSVIHLTPAEVQSGHDRVRWAEGLIRQLPEDHDGRNSWLLNYASPKKAGS